MIQPATLRGFGPAVMVMFVCASGSISEALAQSQPDPSTLQARAARTGTPPVIDGNIHDDPAWAGVQPINGSWQITPTEGAPASEQTEVRFLFTDSTLYVGVIAYDRTPSEIIVADSRRDSSLSDTDSFLLILDTYRDRQNGFVFGTNPAGIQYDAQVTNEGGAGANPTGGGQLTGSGGGFNINWDGDWQVRSEISERGWSAEFAIPFRTLRYPQRAAQTWGLNFQRNIRRRNEISFWAPLPRQYNLSRVSMAGQITGLEIPVQRNLQLTPYVLGEARQHGTDLRGTRRTGDIGADLKYSITPSITLDATVNTDFAQVEVDEQQINLDRFTLFFPEKRPFFLENAGLFAVGTPREAEIFFSRSIGIDENGQQIPILGGARITGQQGATRVGLLDIQTDDLPGRAATNFAVARVNHELPNRSAIGAIFVNRQDTGDLAADEAFNRSYAVDGRWGIGQNGRVSGFLAKTSSPGVKDEQYAYQLDTNYSSQAWLLNLAYSEVADNFNPEVGFLLRPDGNYRKMSATAFYRHRPKDFWSMHEIRPHTSINSYWDLGGFHETFRQHIDVHWELKSGDEFHTGLNLTREGLIAPFTIFPGVIVPPGTYDHAETQLVFFTNRGAPVSTNINLTAGGFFGGTRVDLSPSVTARLGETFNATLSWSRNDIDLPWGDFVTNLARLRVSYSFTPNVFVQSLVQYNDRADLWSTNLRFGWHQKGSSGLFVVYNDTRGLQDSTLLRPDRSFVVKISRLIDVLR
jgi:hypothetical protein